MSGFETLALVAAGIGTGAQVIGQIQAGKAAKQAAEFQAQQAEVNAAAARQAAGQNRAASQRTAIERRRQANLLSSRAQAVAAATGSALDPTSANIISNLEGEGELGALSALYEGETAAYENEDRARLNLSQADASRFEGRVAQQQSYYNALGTAGSFAAKYGSAMTSPTTNSTVLPMTSAQRGEYGPFQNTTPWRNIPIRSGGYG